jgi:signal transduction histidine kinase
MIPIFGKNKEITHVMSVIHDLTRRKELEREAVKAAKLTSIADMAYTIAHEINNPLTGIKLGLSTLYDSLRKKHNIQVLDSVMKDLNRIQDIVNAFLTAKKGLSQIEKTEVSKIDAIIEDVLFHLSGQLNRQNLAIRKELCNSPYYILIDEMESQSPAKSSSQCNPGHARKRANNHIHEYYSLSTKRQGETDLFVHLPVGHRSWDKP